MIFVQETQLKRAQTGYTEWKTATIQFSFSHASVDSEYMNTMIHYLLVTQKDGAHSLLNNLDYLTL